MEKVFFEKEPQIILASASPRRKELLSMIFDHFTIICSDSEENANFKNPEQFVSDLSREKAESVYSKIKNQTDSAIIIGADTIVYHNGKVYGKPTLDNAFEMIQSLSHATHQVYTGVTLLFIEKKADQIGVNKISFSEVTDVKIAALTKKEINDYINSKDPFDKAGGYGIQGVFGKYIEGIDGDYYNVVGLPVHRIYEELKKNCNLFD